MYHSVSETSHPLQTEEQEIGIDPLQSYLNKPGEGEFCISVLFLTLYLETLYVCHDNCTCHNLFNSLNEVEQGNLKNMSQSMCRTLTLMKTTKSQLSIKDRNISQMFHALSSFFNHIPNTDFSIRILKCSMAFCYFLKHGLLHCFGFRDFFCFPFFFF